MGNVISSTLEELPKTLKKETVAVANEILSEMGVAKSAERQSSTSQPTDARDFMKQIYAPKNPLDENGVAQSQKNEEAYREQRLALLRGQNTETLENPAVKQRMESEHRHNASMLGVSEQNSGQEKQRKEEDGEPELKASHEHTPDAALTDNEPILPGSKGRKAVKSKMQRRILDRSKAKAELGKNQGQG